MQYEIHKLPFPSQRAEIWEIPEPAGHPHLLVTCEDFRDAPRIVRALRYYDGNYIRVLTVPEGAFDPRAVQALLHNAGPVILERKDP